MASESLTDHIDTPPAFQTGADWHNVQHVQAQNTRLRTTSTVERAADFLKRHASEGVRIAHVSQIVGVSERTLRNAFRATYGLSPKQFDLRERLFAARRALCMGHGAHPTVTRTACEFGFFELGRFARAYKAAFGESPSQTIKLRHQIAGHR